MSRILPCSTQTSEIGIRLAIMSYSSVYSTNPSSSSPADQLLIQTAFQLVFQVQQRFLKLSSVISAVICKARFPCGNTIAETGNLRLRTLRAGP